MKTTEEKVGKEFSGSRVDYFLREKMRISTALIRKIKYTGVAVNGKIVTMRYTVNEGDTVSVTLPDMQSENILPIEMELDIVYEDEYVLAINKPRDMPTHPSRGNHLPTLAEGVMAYMKPPFVFRAVNRLDRDTSGIVLIAKDAISAAKLSKQIADRQIEKKYIALVCGVPSQSHGIIDAPIERESEDTIKRVVREDGKRAITEYKVIGIRDGIGALCEVTLHTGRTHQIRVHMAYIGHPLYSDFLYGKEVDGEVYRLHSKSISFNHPKTGERITLTAECPF
jgi:23S rRNA pseudouridine1911/1915/1917 synthase